MAVKSLVQKAKESIKHNSSAKIRTRGEVDLALAYAAGEVAHSQVARALRIRPSGVSAWLGSVLKYAIKSGQLVRRRKKQ
jgi:hypothetical protein